MLRFNSLVHYRNASVSEQDVWLENLKGSHPQTILDIFENYWTFIAMEQ